MSPKPATPKSRTVLRLLERFGLVIVLLIIGTALTLLASENRCAPG